MESRHRKPFQKLRSFGHQKSQIKIINEPEDDFFQGETEI